MLEHRICSLLLAGIALAVPINAQETTAEVRRQIQAVQKETAREKELHQTEIKRHAQFKEGQAEKRRNLDAQAQTLRAQLDSVRAEITTLSEASRKATGQARWFQQRKDRYQKDLALYLDSLIPQLESDFPYKAVESAASLRETSAQLVQGVIGPEEALGRALDLLLDRLQLGFGVEIWSGFHKEGARSISGKFFRYGAVAALFVSQDGNEVFFLTGDPTAGWKWQATTDFARRAALKETLKVAEGKAAPRLVTLPFPKLATGGAK